MSDHLPECPGGVRPAKPANGNGPEIQYVIFGSGICICDRLRACEQRVRMENDDYAYVAAQAEADGRRHGFAEGVQAARDAVAGVGVRKDTSYDMRVQALAAIDALRGDR